jgi:hypothetical protein
MHFDTSILNALESQQVGVDASLPTHGNAKHVRVKLVPVHHRLTTHKHKLIYIHHAYDYVYVYIERYAHACIHIYIYLHTHIYIYMYVPRTRDLTFIRASMDCSNEE